MPIISVTGRPTETLQAFYSDLSANSTNNDVRIGQRMLDLIGVINELFETPVIWGLSSHARLVLQTSDYQHAKRYVIIENVVGEEYHFQYLIPAEKQPWDNAFVYGIARSLSESKRYLLIAMKETGAWTDNEELKKGLKANNIV